MTSEVWKEYLNQAPTDKREFRTLEIFHPDFSELIRLVEDYEDQTLLLEAAAPRNPSLLVLFTGVNIKIREPGERPNVSAVLDVSMGAVGNVIQDQLDLITPAGRFTPVEVIYRRFYEGDTSGPVRVFYLSAGSLKFQGYTGVGFTAQDIDLANRPAGEIYTLERFPGLKEL